MTDFKTNPYVLVWNDDFKNSQHFSDLYEALSAFDTQLLSHKWNKENMYDTLYLKQYISDGYFNTNFEVFDSKNIAFGSIDDNVFSNFEEYTVFASNDTFNPFFTIREKLQEISMDTYYVATLCEVMERKCKQVIFVEAA